MHHILSRVSVGVLIFTILFSVIACLTLTFESCVGHTHSSVSEHSAHMQLLTLAVVPTATMFIFASISIIVVAYVPLVFSESAIPVIAYSSPPRRKKLARILSQLRSPPRY